MSHRCNASLAVVAYAGTTSRDVCRAAQAVPGATLCHPELAFVFVAVNGQEDQLARQAIWSLQYHGQWSGPIVFISTCDKQTTTSASGSFHRIKLSSQHSTLPAFRFHQGRLAELLRFVPGHINTVCPSDSLYPGLTCCFNHSAHTGACMHSPH